MLLIEQTLEIMYVTVHNRIVFIYILEAVKKYPVIDNNLIMKFEPHLEHIIGKVSIKNVLSHSFIIQCLININYLFTPIYISYKKIMYISNPICYFYH